MQKLKSQLMRTQSLNVLPLEPGVGQYIAIEATLTARDFFLTYFYPSSPFNCIFSKPLPNLFLCWLWLTPVPVWASRIKEVTLPHAGSRFECPRNINRLQGMCYCFWFCVPKLWIEFELWFEEKNNNKHLWYNDLWNE